MTTPTTPTTPLTDVGYGTPATLGELTKGRGQVFADTSQYDYVSYLRAADGVDLGPLVENPSKTDLTVALIGGGIANIIAAYELSRCGVQVTVYEAENFVGGRFYTTQSTQADSGPREWGAEKLPKQSKMLWHYVRQVALDAYDNNAAVVDAFKAQPFPNAGTVPTQVAQQNGWSDAPVANWKSLPPVVLEATGQWSAFLASLNDGQAEPATKYWADIQYIAQTGRLDPSDTSIERFWRRMIELYEHKSLGEVLRTEVFAGRPDDVEALMHSFATWGNQSGGTGHMFDVGFLEVLRGELWNSSQDYCLPRSADYDKLWLGMGPFAAAFARLAHKKSQAFFAGREFGDMFRTNREVGRITVGPNAQGVDKVVVHYANQALEYDFAIVGMSSRAMQALGLDRNYPWSPFHTGRQGITPEAQDFAYGVQAAIHRANLVPAAKWHGAVTSDVFGDEWPENPKHQPVRAFVTDQYPHYVNVMDTWGLTRWTRVSALCVGNDALKLQSLDPDLDEGGGPRKATMLSAFEWPGDGPIIPQQLVSQALAAYPQPRFGDWSNWLAFGGGFKLDRPGGTYATGCLFYHYTLAGPTEPAVQPWARVFLAGDSVSFLGSWAEGAAMTALNATTAVLAQMVKLKPDLGAIRSHVLLFGSTLFRTVKMDPGATVLPRTKLVSRSIDCTGDPARPGNWTRDAPLPSDPVEPNLTKLAVSRSGRRLAGTVRLANDDQIWTKQWWDGDWPQFQLVPKALIAVADLDIDSEMTYDTDTDTGREGGAAMVAVVADKTLLYANSRIEQTGAWTKLTPVMGEDGTPVLAQRCALAFTGQAADFQLEVFFTAVGGQLAHVTRYANATWSPVGLVDWPVVPVARDVAAAGVFNSEFTILGIVTQTGQVSLAVRNGGHRVLEWRAIPNPRDERNRVVQAVTLQLVAGAEQGAGQVLILGQDGNLWFLPFHLGKPAPGAYQWRRVPFPASTPYQPLGVAFGAQVPNTPAVRRGSVTVLTTSNPI